MSKIKIDKDVKEILQKEINEAKNKQEGNEVMSEIKIDEDVEEIDENLQELVQKELMRIKNEILKAFIVEYDCMPSEVEIAENGDDFGNLVGFCVRKQDIDE